MWRKLLPRVAVLVVTVIVVVGLAGPGPALLMDDGGDGDDETLSNPEYEPSSVVPEPLPARGTVDPQPSADAGDGGTVLIDRGHGNRISRAQIEPLVDALVRQGYSVEFYTDGDLATHLADADAFLVVDPSSEFLPGDVNDIREFTGNGGHLVMVGEPDRITVSVGLLGTSIQSSQSRLTTLASTYGMSLDTQYLYNQEHADGTYKHVLVRPTDEGGVDDVDSAAMYTAAAVTVRDGTVLLRSAPNTHKSGTDEVTGEYPVAVRTDNALLMGDKTMLQSDRYNVADNEEFVAYLVEFMIAGDNEAPADADTEGSDDDETATTTPQPTAASADGKVIPPAHVVAV
jgi:hypothetical protein